MSVIRDDGCTFAFNRIASGVLEIVIDGIDTGQFGTAPLDEISIALIYSGRRAVRGPENGRGAPVRRPPPTR